MITLDSNEISVKEGARQMNRTLTKEEAIENIRQLIKARQKDNIKCYEFQLHRIEKSEM